MPEKILVVDDEPDMLKLLKIIISEKTPHEVVTTNNPLEALELSRQGSFDIIIADLKMPGLDGLGLLKAIRETNEEIPVIIITAFGTIESAEEAMHRGAFDFITKPFRKEQILFTLEKAIKWCKLQRENKELKAKLGG